MLIAETKNGERVSARNVTKGEDYFCPVCRSPLILRQGLVRIPHFAHTSKNGNNCIFRGGGEGLNHDLMKTVVKKLLDKDNPYFKSEFEYRFDNGRIADICYRNKYHTIAIECVDKHTNLKDFEEKLRMYRKDNIKSMWIFDVKKFQDDNGKFQDEMSISEIMKRCHQMNYAKIWAVDTEHEQIYAIHFDTVYRDRFGFNPETYEEWIFTEKLKNIKQIIPHLQKDLKFYLKNNNRYNKHIVGPFCESFWKITTLKEEGIDLDWWKGCMDIYTPLGNIWEYNCDCINTVYRMLENIGYSRTNISYFDKDLRKKVKYEFENREGCMPKCFKCTIYNRHDEYSHGTECGYYFDVVCREE